LRPGSGDAFAIPFSLLAAGFGVFWLTIAYRAPFMFMFFLGVVPILLMSVQLLVGRFIYDAYQRRHTATACPIGADCSSKEAGRSCPALKF
jgi:hypothetical protein